MPSGYLDHPRPLAFAPRGGAGHYPENSWKAFEHAVKLGYAYLETDVHATSDGVVLAFHDKTLDRVTDLKGASWLGALGLNPTLEAVSIQLLVILFAFATYSVVQRNNRLMREEKPAARPAE